CVGSFSSIKLSSWRVSSLESITSLTARSSKKVGSTTSFLSLIEAIVDIQNCLKNTKNREPTNTRDDKRLSADSHFFYKWHVLLSCNEHMAFLFRTNFLKVIMSH